MSYQQEYLRDHAVRNVWSHPRQDRHYIFAPKRLTSGAGAIRSYTLMWDDIALPDTYSRWHIFQLNSLNPTFLSWFARTLQWVSFEEAANDKRLSINIYNVEGVEVPRSTSYYRFTESGALIFAIRTDLKIPVQWATDAFYLRTYNNAYWSLPGTTVGSTFKVHGKRMESASDVSAFVAAYQADAALVDPHQIAYYLNGVRRNVFTPGLIGVGDTPEYTIDTSIKASVRIPLKDLQVFESTLDSKRKYLFHYAGKGDNVIDYFDDCDFYVISSKTAGAKLFYHHNAPDAVRQLTHKDYSLVVPYVQRHFDALKRIYADTLETTMVEVNVRRGGYHRELIKEGTMIHELYKLPDELVSRAMVGMDATVPFWQAANLEASKYSALMRASTMCDISASLVEQAYGYHAAAKTIGDNFAKVETIEGISAALVPYLYAFGATVYEYNSQGVMLGYHHHYQGQSYTAKEEDCAFVEFCGGFGGSALDEYNNVREMTLRADSSYRVYLRKNIAGVIQADVTDVTSSSLYTITNNVFKWTSVGTTDYPVLVSDRNFFAADYEISMASGRAQISIQTLQRRGNETAMRSIVIPPGEVDVFVNGRALIYGLEYFFKQGIVYITTVYNLNRSQDKQQVHVRMRGFCNADLSLRTQGDIGFIAHDLLSANKRFDLRDGRVMRLVIAGQTFMRDGLEFSEDSTGVAVTGGLNGYPYQLKDAYVPIHSSVVQNTYELIDQDAARAKAVGDYLTKLIPEPSRGPVVAQKIGYQVFSTFFLQLITDLRYNRILLSNKTSFTRQEVLEICKSYEYLLQVDPLSTKIDHTWLSILPHPYSTPVGLATREYQFLKQAVDIYAKDKVDIRTAVFIQA